MILKTPSQSDKTSSLLYFLHRFLILSNIQHVTSRRFYATFVPDKTVFPEAPREAKVTLVTQCGFFSPFFHTLDFERIEAHDGAVASSRLLFLVYLLESLKSKISRSGHLLVVSTHSLWRASCCLPKHFSRH
jgi:hypothetical protein